VSIRESLLALLAAGPRHGYQLRAEFEAATGGVWPLNVGQVYTTLERLERDGLVRGGEPDPDGRRSFELTADGRDAIAGFMSTPGGREAPSRDGLMMKVLIAVAAPGVDALQVIAAERSARMAVLQERRRGARGSGSDAALAQRLALDALVALTESELRWLDLCEERILAAARASSDPDKEQR
jgi:DNA-binding PadR family transcriptional regulator